MKAKAYTLKSKTHGLQLGWILVWGGSVPPTHADFQTQYGDEYYAPFHKDEEIVELVEKQ